MPVHGVSYSISAFFFFHVAVQGKEANLKNVVLFHSTTLRPIHTERKRKFSLMLVVFYLSAFG